MNKNKNKLVIYQTKAGSLEFKGDFNKDTIWATQTQIVELFSVDQSVVSRHIRNIFSDKEIDSKSNMQKMHIANSDKPVAYYSLDVILAVGYRTNSKVAVEFRKWATKVLRQHILEGYTVNRKRLAENYQKFQNALNDVKRYLPVTNKLRTSDVLDLVKMFASTWLSLDAYDKASLPKAGNIKKKISVTAGELSEALLGLKENLVKQGTATDIFGQKKGDGGTESIVRNIFQSYAGKDLYPTLEEKAANLLYFIAKGHPFLDGNKRSAAFSFIWFLQKSGILASSEMTPEALTALTLLVAESNPKDKEKIIGLILMLIKK